MYRTHSVRGISRMYLLISLCDNMPSVCNVSGLKHSMALCVFAWFLIVFLCINCRPCCTSLVLAQQRCVLV